MVSEDLLRSISLANTRVHSVYVHDAEGTPRVWMSYMAVISTPLRSQRNLNAFKRIYSNSPSSVTPNSKPKTKKTKEDDPEEEKISLKDVYNLVKQLKSDIDTKDNTMNKRRIIAVVYAT